MLRDFFPDEATRMLESLLEADETAFRAWLGEFLKNADDWQEDQSGRDDSLRLARLASRVQDLIEGLRASNRRLAQDALSQSLYLSNMLYEVRIPLNAIIGFLELVSASNIEGLRPDYLREVRTASELILQLIRTTPGQSVQNSDLISLMEIPYTVRTLLEDTVALHAPAAAAKGLDIQALIHSDVPTELTGDPGRVRQILNNLLSNAIKFTESGEILLEAFGRVDTDGRPQLQLIVSDTGIGISDEQLKQLTKPVGTVREEDGAAGGFGLETARRLAELMGGTIEIRSRVGDGTSLHVMLRQLPGIPNRHEPLPDPISLSGKRILVIGEGRNQHEVLDAYLSQCGVVVRHADSPAHALRSLNPGTQGHLIADAVLLCGDPEAVATSTFPKRLEDLLPDALIPVVLIATRPRRGDLKLAQDNGFIGYIPVPVRHAELIDSLALAFDPRHAAPSTKTTIITRHLVMEARHAMKDRVLVAEDNRINQKLVQMMLARLGFECDIAANGREAIQALSGNQYRFLLLDWQMPIMDGFTAARAIRASSLAQKEIPIIAMNAFALQTDSQEFIGSGMDDWILKPVTLVDLRRIVMKFCPVTPTSPDMLTPVEESIRALARDAGLSRDDAAEIVNEYVSLLPATLGRIRSLISEQNWDALRRELHTAKGASGNVRFSTLSLVIGAFEKSMKEQDYGQAPTHYSAMVELLTEIGVPV